MNTYAEIGNIFTQYFVKKIGEKTYLWWMWSGSYGPASNTGGYRLHKCQQYPEQKKVPISKKTKMKKTTH